MYEGVGEGVGEEEGVKKGGQTKEGNKGMREEGNGTRWKWGRGGRR